MVIERAVPGAIEWDDVSAEHLARYCFAAAYVEGRQVLDAGTGPGYGAMLLRVSGAAGVQAIDIDAETIEVAGRDYGSEGLSFFVDDCQKLERVRAPVDIICSFENIEHLDDPEHFLGAASRLLAPAGTLLCSSPDRAFTPAFVEGKPTNPHHRREWYREEFADLLSKYFSEVEVRVQVRANSLARRQQAVEALSRHLSYLWGRPMLRLTRGIGALFGKKRPWPDIAGLASASVSDFPILHASTAQLVGQSVCHYAICKGPAASQ